MDARPDGVDARHDGVDARRAVEPAVPPHPTAHTPHTDTAPGTRRASTDRANTDRRSPRVLARTWGD
ncbi:hypothetical protein, partial [Streptomyces sp. NPDC007369]|uniref:hypothetical protein n=1 Tax=Streptomyces sp. NPDC007369 TaxID=3154589 RepID=UPI0033C4AB86